MTSHLCPGLGDPSQDVNCHVAFNDLQHPGFSRHVAPTRPKLRTPECPSSSPLSPRAWFGSGYCNWSGVWGHNGLTDEGREATMQVCGQAKLSPPPPKAPSQ